MTKDLLENHNRDVDRLDKELEKKVSKTTFQATIAPIRNTSSLIIGAVISVIIALAITAFT